MAVDSQERFDDDVVNLGPQKIVVDAHSLQVLRQRTDAPFVSKVALIRILVLNEGLTLLVDGVVR